jgi:hypothetical protein
MHHDRLDRAAESQTIADSSARKIGQIEEIYLDRVGRQSAPPRSAIARVVPC